MIPGRGAARTGQLSASVVPGETGLARTKGFIAEEAGLNHESEMFAERVKMQFSSGGYQRVLTENDDAFSMLSREALKANAEIDFLSGEQFFAEAAALAKRGGFAKNK